MPWHLMSTYAPSSSIGLPYRRAELPVPLLIVTLMKLHPLHHVLQDSAR